MAHNPKVVGSNPTPATVEVFTFDLHTCSHLGVTLISVAGGVAALFWGRGPELGVGAAGLGCVGGGAVAWRGGGAVGLGRGDGGAGELADGFAPSAPGAWR